MGNVEVRFRGYGSIGARQGKLTPFIAIIGLHRSGSSCVAGVLHKLGVYLGEQLGGYEISGGFEAKELIDICETAYPFPTTISTLTESQIVTALRNYIAKTRQQALVRGVVAGGKYPQLCAMGKELKAACNDLRILHINRPLDDSIRSLQERSRKLWNYQKVTAIQAEAVQRWLWQRKNEFIESSDCLTIDYYSLTRNPEKEIGRIIDYFELSPSPSNIVSSIEHVKPSRTLG